MMGEGAAVSRILVTCGRKPGALKHYVPALRLAGWEGEVVLVDSGDPRPEVETYAGVLVTGGRDIHPSLWDPQEAPHPESDIDAERDALEAPVLRRAWELRRPILGICRGAQLLNVVLGGSLVQHLPDWFGCPEDLHRHGTAEEPELRHTVNVDPESRLAALVGAEPLEVNSRHHQAVQRLAPTLRAVAWHPGTRRGEETLVEAVEAVERARFALGVQWHPENLVGLTSPAGQRSLGLFRGFLDAVRA